MERGLFGKQVECNRRDAAQPLGIRQNIAWRRRNGALDKIVPTFIPHLYCRSFCRRWQS
jgi:hypothetical protein